MKKTYSLTSARSDFLKKVDEAIKTYNMAPTATNRQGLRTAFDRWRFEQSKQGKNWRESVRNEKGAVTDLYRALTEVDKRQLTAAELEAMQYISRMQALALQKMFDGKTVQFRSSTLVGIASGAGSNGRSLKPGRTWSLRAAAPLRALCRPRRASKPA